MADRRISSYRQKSGAVFRGSSGRRLAGTGPLVHAPQLKFCGKGSTPKGRVRDWLGRGALGFIGVSDAVRISQAML